MPGSIYFSLWALAGLVLGTLSALWAGGLFGYGPKFGQTVSVEGWQSDWSIGSQAANPWLRARIARHGLLALRKDEAVYFTRSTDAEGRVLRSTCDYRLSGGAQPAAWWSITLYAAGSRLPMNTDSALSIDATQVAEAGGQAANQSGSQSGATWAATISPEQPGSGGLWLSSRGADRFDLTLRLYRPDAALLDEPERTLAPPLVERTTCRGAPE